MSQEQGRCGRSADSKEVLVLGAGHVSGPLIEYLCRDPKVHVTVVSNLEHEVNKQRQYAAAHNNMKALIMDVTQKQEALTNLIGDSDLVISLLPYSLHPRVAKICVQQKTNMLTASYLTNEMKELHGAAKEAGISIVNEVGLDPGIDHLLAKQVIDQVATSGGRITSFYSYCCGLPTPEFADNPLGYKFGWNPAGAFAITMNGAKWKENNEIKEIKPGHLMEQAKGVESFLKGFALEAFPNRDSTLYQELYNLPDAKTILRGSMRYKGFSDTIMALKGLGLMDQTAHPCLQPETGSDFTWRQLMAELLGQPQDLSLSNLKNLIYDKVGKSARRLQSIVDLGLLDEELVDKCVTPFNTIRSRIIQRYPFKTGENDLIIMKIIFGIEWPDKTTEEKSLSLVVYGEQNGGFSAMAKTVGYPAAIAAKMVLEGEIQRKGMIVPLQPEIYHPLLKRLKDEGIYARE